MNFKGKTILVVDDDPDVVKVLDQTLSSRGAAVHTAADGVAAIEVAKGAPPDLVILDMMLPKRGGLLVLERLKRRPPGDKVPYVIMITANEGVRHRTYAESLGVDAYINKPFRMSRLLGKVRELLTPEDKKDNNSEEK